MAPPIKIASLNVCGLADFNRRQRLLLQLTSLNSDILFLQKTHVSTPKQIEDLKNSWPGPSFWAPVPYHSSGTAILFNPHLDVKITYFHHHLDGCISFLTAKINQKNYTLLSIYAPNTVGERNDFFNYINTLITQKQNIILTGDFNFVEDPNLDKLNGNPYRGVSNRKLFQKIKPENKLIDPFRHLHPEKKEYTYICPAAKTKIRLDRIYVSQNLSPSITHSSHHHILHADHLAVLILLATHITPPPKGYWKCNVSVLKDCNFIDDFCPLWKKCEHKLETEPSWETWDLFKTQLKNLIINHSKRLASNRKQSITHLNKKSKNYNPYPKMTQ